MNYFNYFTEIEEFFIQKRGTFKARLSTLDWVLIEGWQQQGIPLEIVLKGVDRAFSRAKREINSLGYCVKAVAEVLDEEKETRIDKNAVPEVSGEETRKYLEDLAQKTSVLAKTYPEFASKITSIADSIRSVNPSNFRDAEQILSALEEKLVALVKVAADENTLIEIQRTVTSELGPFRSSMNTEQLAMLEQQLWKRTLMEKHNLPRLSLFYLI